MLPYLLRRLFNAALIFLGLSLLVYLLIYLSPADPAQVIAAQRLGGPASSEVLAQVQEEYGLDQPVPMQYLRWLGQAVQGDFGYSIRTGNLIVSEMATRVGFSALLGTAAMALTLLIGTIFGTWAALKPDSVSDNAIRFTGLVWVAIPDFWFAFLLILIFAVHLGFLPSFGARSSLHLILPAITLAGPQAARLSQLIRSILLDVLRQDYMRTAKSKGLLPSAQLFRHAMPNIAVPFVTVVAYQFSALISGTIIIETVFSWPGLGSYYIEAVNFRDLPVIQATVLAFGAVIIFFNLLADLAYGVFDPRLRLN